MDGLGGDPTYEFAQSVERGVCLHRSCHAGRGGFHSVYGWVNNTAEQFAKFYRNRTGRDFSDIYDLDARRWKAAELRQLLTSPDHLANTA